MRGLITHGDLIKIYYPLARYGNELVAISANALHFYISQIKKVIVVYICF